MNTVLSSIKSIIVFILVFCFLTQPGASLHEYQLAPLSESKTSKEVLKSGQPGKKHDQVFVWNHDGTMSVIDHKMQDELENPDNKKFVLPIDFTTFRLYEAYIHNIKTGRITHDQIKDDLRYPHQRLSYLILHMLHQRPDYDEIEIIHFPFWNPPMPGQPYPEQETMNKMVEKHFYVSLYIAVLIILILAQIPSPHGIFFAAFFLAASIIVMIFRALFFLILTRRKQISQIESLIIQVRPDFILIPYSVLRIREPMFTSYLLNTAPDDLDHPYSDILLKKSA
ncbi:MAG: hypothetical protein JW774_12595 [Candidatus Aureabacteria bacterium]|nr:hypothetical protein [Candidatus Auribacterota bacterium]